MAVVISNPPVFSKLPEYPLMSNHSTGMDIASIHRPGYSEWNATLRPLPHERTSEFARRFVLLIARHRAEVIKLEIFSPLSARAEMLEVLSEMPGYGQWPITWVEGLSEDGQRPSGLHVMAIQGVQVDTLRLKGRSVGRCFSDGYARHLILGEILADDTTRSRPEQAQEAFDNLVAALALGGMELTDTVRTWLFLDRILEWYGPFNTVRTELFQKHRLFDHLVPASTGVSGRNAAGSAFQMMAWAVQPLSNEFTINEVSSPLQCPAPQYGSSFSRAVELNLPGLQRITVSGTASIEPGGKTVHLDDSKAQIELSMQVVEAILESRSMTFQHATRVSAYFKDIKDVPLFEAWRRRRGLENWPVICTQVDICRDDLLFELEMDAMAATHP